ncbi:hypothetical protein J2Z25_003075 [Clostridium tertium]|nr:hypothetical protein [Clostridium tertium]
MEFLIVYMFNFKTIKNRGNDNIVNFASDSLSE